jgi:SAM-dependent methyltransferase
MFDGYADHYDKWFMANDKVFLSELKLLHHCLEPLKKDKILSVGCGSGLFESVLNKEYGINNIYGLEPSQDMAKIAVKRGIDVKPGNAETGELPSEEYDIIYFNGCSTYIPDLKKAYENCYSALKKGGHFILLDVPKESAYGILYSFAKHVGNYDKDIFDKIAPELPYPIELVTSGIFYTTLDKAKIIKEYLNMTNIKFYQTLTGSPVYTNDAVEEPISGYDKGGYVAIVAQK